MNIDFEFACQDDCLDKMVPSDLRKLVAERDAALGEVVKSKTMLEGFCSALEIGIENNLSCAELKKAIQLAGAKVGEQ